MKRIKRINSLLKEVIAEVIRNDVRNPQVSDLTTVTEVDISNDLSHAKVYISVIGTEQERQITVNALKSASGFISMNASKKVVMRTFPTLTFRIDNSVDKQMKIDALLKKIQEEKNLRDNNE